MIRPRPNLAEAVRRFIDDRRGQSLVFAVFTIFTLVVMALMIIGVERTTTKKIKLQNAADASTLAAVLVEADALAQIAWINEAMASIYYDAMRACVDTATSAVLAQLADGEGLHDWSRSPKNVVGHGRVDPSPPPSIVGGDARSRWASVYEKAAKRVPRAEKWLKRLSQVERAIAVLAPELMRHQMMYAARRNLAGDAASIEDYRDAVRVASYPDLNRDRLYEGRESKTLTFISDQPADFNKAIVTKIGDPGEYPNGWIFDARETNDFHMVFRHDAHSDGGGLSDTDSRDDRVRRFFQWSRRGVDGWHDTWEASVTRDGSTTAYAVKFHDAERDGLRNIDELPSHDYLFRMIVDSELRGEKLVRQRVVANPAAAKFGRIERYDIYDRVANTWTVIVTYVFAQSGSGAHGGGRFDAGDKEICVWEGAGASSSMSGKPDRRVKVKADGTPGIWNEEKGRYEDPPESFELANVNGIQVPVTMADRFFLGGPDDGTVLNWDLPLTLWFHGQQVTLNDPLDISYDTPVGCHGWVHFSPDDKSARVHGLSTRTPDKEWSAPHADRRRHRLYACEDADDEWIYEWIDAGPLLRDMPGRRFGYHAIMDRLHAGQDYAYPRPDENEGANWRLLLSAEPVWPARRAHDTMRSSIPAHPAEMPVWARLAEPEDPEAGDAAVPNARVDEPFGGWFDIATGRPQDLTMTQGVRMGRYNPAGFSVTVPCWYCGDKGTESTRLVDVDQAVDSKPYERGADLGDGRVSGCGFWHEVFADEEAWEARVSALNRADASGRTLRSTDANNPYKGLFMIQVRCPLQCARSWEDGTRPARLDAYGRYKGDDERKIPTHVRVTLRDAATLAWTHPDNAGKNVRLDGRSVAASGHRPRRAKRELDYGYCHADPATHWVRDFFGVFRDELRNDDGDKTAIVVPAEPDGDIAGDFWDTARPPLEVNAVTGELFRTGITVCVWTDIEDWMSRLWPGRKPTASSAVEDIHKNDMRMAQSRELPDGAVFRPLPGVASEADHDWRDGRVNPLAEAPWGGLFAFSNGRVFYPPAAGETARRRYNFPWTGTDTNRRDLLEQVVNPERDAWLDSPVNLFDPDWHGGLVPVGAAVDMRDLELDVMTGESDFQFFLRRRMTTVPFRHSVSANDHRAYNHDSVYGKLRTGLYAPPGQRRTGQPGQAIQWFERGPGERGIEQGIAK